MPVIYATAVPPPPLDRFIENFWYWEGEAPGHAKDTIMASGRVGLLVNLKRDELSWYGGERFAALSRLKGIALCGTHSSAFAIDAHQPHMMGVQFRAGGAFPFFKPPAREFQNAHISLSDIWGGDAERLHQRLVQAPTPEDKFEILQRALIAAAPRAFVRHPVVEEALASFARAPHKASVARLAAEAGVSHKRLIKLFADEVGFTPKLYLRVTRFQRVLLRIFQAPQVDWGDMVERHGYFDQSHFIRDFREFSGLTPSEYLIRRGPYLQHVPLSN
ncbi:MAG TPA: helix-turn-helix domain-containing protein [Rhizomicrobium sp.]|jgi:AraC-like DNA-binding protein